MIYFIQSGDSEFVKIGYCLGKPETRLRQLQCGNPEPLRLIAVRDGSRDDESYWHQQFAHLRVRGEWFKWCDEIKEYATPLLADPEVKRRARQQYARDIVAGRASTQEVYEQLLGIRRAA